MLSDESAKLTEIYRSHGLYGKTPIRLKTEDEQS